MEGIFKKKYKKVYLAILFAVVLILIPTSQANASCGIIFSGSISDCILEGTSYFAYLMFTVVGSGIVALVKILQWVINIPVYPDSGIAVIQKSWEIMRNFANMFFIVALIMMAFATIFDVLPGAAKYNARALFGRFLLTALLINFSLVLGVMVIHGTQVLSNTFLTAIGDMSGQLGQALNPSLLLPNASATTVSQAVDQGIFGALISLIFALVLAVTFLFSLLTAVIFSFVRIPILWALLVVSPIAWILNIFPAGEGTFKKWWGTFIGWNMFLPIFLFFLYFGLYFLSKQDEVMQAIAGSSSTGSVLGDVGTSFTFQILFMYIMAGIFLIGGTIVAMKASMFSGTGVVQVAGWARGTVANRWLGRQVANKTGVTAAGEALEAKRQQIAKEGIRIGGRQIFGGREAQERQTARFKGMLGIPGEESDTYIKQAKERELRLDKTPLQQARTQADTWARNGSEIERIAARNWQAKKGYLDAGTIAQTITDFGGENNPIALEFAKSAKPAIDKWTYDQKRDALGNLQVRSHPELQKTIAMSMANAKQLRDPADLRRLIDVFQADPEGLNNFLEAVDKAGINILYERNDMLAEMATDLGHGQFNNLPADVGQKIRGMMAKKLKDMKAIQTYDQLNNSIQAVGENTGDARDILTELRKFNRALLEEYDAQVNPRPNEIGQPIATRINNRMDNYFSTTSPIQIRENNTDFWNNNYTQQALTRLSDDMLKEIAVGASGQVRQTINNLLIGRGQNPLGTPPTGPAGPATPLATPPTTPGRGTGQYRGPVGFAPPTPPASNPPNPPGNVNPNNVVNLRNPNNPNNTNNP